jgi:uncharacterized membrane protein YfcA
VVHFSNNLFKIILVGKFANKKVLLKFGIPAIFASFLGAWLLLRMTVLPSLFYYQLFGNTYEVTLINLVIAILLMGFSILDVVPRFQKLQFSGNKLVLGGILSGFFGGLAGIQGALRTAFLIKSGLTKDAFIATGVVIACFVDFTRLSVYASRFSASNLHENTTLLISATLSAIVGAVIGRILLKKITLRYIQIIVAIMLFIISIVLGMGII